jgi:hypothetical protein
MHKATNGDEMKPVSALFEFANIPPEETGIGTTIWVQFVPDDKKIPHDIRLKAAPNNTKTNLDEMCDIVFDRTGKIIEMIPNKSGKIIMGKNKRNLQKWIYLNIDILILHWTRQIGSVEFIRKLKSLKNTNVKINVEAK